MHLANNLQKVHGVLNIQHWNTEQGVPVYFVRTPHIPMFDLQLIVNAGSAHDGEQSGLAYFTNALLNEGTTQLSADELAQAFEEKGAEFSVSSYRDMATLSVRSLNQLDILNDIVETFSQVISQPAFFEKALKRMKSQLFTALQYEAQRPDIIAKKLFFSQLYGQHPYAKGIKGTPQSIESFTREAVESFYQKYYVAQNAQLVLVGALTLEQAQEIAQKVSSVLPHGHEAQPLPEPETPLFLHPVKESFPAEQMHIMMGTLAIKRGDPDFFALSLGNHILGGNSTVTRIFNEIRHKRGLAYDVYSYIMPMKAQGPFIIGMQTKASQATQALEILQSTLKDFVQNGPSELEIQQAKLNILGGYHLLFDSNKAIMANLSMLAFYNFPLQYFDEYKNKIQAITSEAIKAVFQKRIHPDNMLTVMVGPN